MRTRLQGWRRLSLAALLLVFFVTSVAAAEPFRDSQSAGSEAAGADAYTPGFGFMVLLSASGDGPGLEDFKKDIDILAETGQEWVRMGIVGWEVMEVWGQERNILWDDAALNDYEAAIDYANSKGLSIYLITADADNNPNTAFNDYKATLRQYWDTLARRFAHKVDVWQVYSESDSAHFQLITEPLEDITPEYLSDLGSMLAIARTSVKSVNPRVLMTTTTMGWPMSDATQDRWHEYFDGISQHLDVISLDMYPADNVKEIKKLPKRIKDIQRRYGKPVIVAEVGLQVAGHWTSEDQRLFVPAAIEAAKKARPLAIIVYQLRDYDTNAFGLIREDREPRPSFPEVIEVMKY